MTSVAYYELDREVFNLLNTGIDGILDWQGAASGIADYVASWGIERFWAMSRSPVAKDGITPNNAAASDYNRRYFAWEVAREVLCKIAGKDLGIKSDMKTDDFQAKFKDLDFNQQALMADLLIEIADTIQFWTMRLKDAKDSGCQV